MNRPFLSSTGPLYQNEIKCLAFDMEMILHCRANKTHFHKKVCALDLISKVRVLELGSGLLENDVWYSFTRIAKILAVKYITVVPLLNTKNFSFTDSSLGPLRCKTSYNLNFYNTDTCVMRILGSVPFGVPFKMVWLSRLWQKVTPKTTWISIVNQSF